MKRALLVGGLLLALLLGLAPLGSLLAQDDENQRTPLTPKIDLMDPIKDFVSGRAWLMAVGIDPAVAREMPRKDPITGRAWEDLAAGFRVFDRPGPVLQGLGPGAGVPYRNPAPAFSRNILMTRDLGDLPFQTEPSIAVDPSDPDHLVTSVIDYNFPGVSSYVSIDGGTTWEGPIPSKYLRKDLAAAGDPVVAFDRQGNPYVSSISLGIEEFSVGPLVAVATVSSIAVTNSADGGFTWQEPTSAARSTFDSDTFLDVEGRVRGEVRFSFLDKPWMTVGPHPTEQGQDVVYVTYTDFVQRAEIFYSGELPFLGLPTLETTIRLARSLDGGQTWSDPVAVSPTVRRVYGEAPGGDGGPLTGARRVVQGSAAIVASDGTVYVAWMDSTDDDTFEGQAEIYVARSTDAGATFSRPVRAASFQEPGFSPRTAFFRYWGTAFPHIATGPNNEVYVVYTALPTDKPFDDGDTYFVRSLDGGQTWDSPVRLNQDETDRAQFFPTIATSPDGTVHVMWADMRDDPSEIRYHIYYTRSQDRGETWGFENKELGIQSPDTRVTDFPSNPNRAFPRGLFIGDYFSMAATDQDVYMVWPDSRLGEFGPVNQKIAFARLRPVPAPEIFVSPPEGPGGQPITVQAFNLQPDTPVFLRVGGVVVAADRTNSDGRLTTQLFIPISGEGAHSVEVFDESGNVATASFFMDFGFDNIQDTQREIVRRLDSLETQTLGAPSGETLALQQEIKALRQLLEGQPVLQTNSPGTSEDWPAWMIVGVTLSGVFLVGSVGLLVYLRSRLPGPRV